MISVCLATYNGARFVEEQLRSILLQLAPEDELIVCDDASSDDTCNVIRQLADARIALHAYSQNVGHVRNFERAISAAKGDFIFLSDQDDVWVPGKIRAMLDCLEANPDVELVNHALATVDAEGQPLSTPLNPLREGRQNRLGYLLRQLVKCQVFGCAVGFRRRLLDVLLPFPRSVYAHDHWLAVAAGVRGPVYFLAEPLVQYRLHGANVTPRGGLHWQHRIFVRVRLLQQILIVLGRQLAPSKRAFKVAR